METEQFWKLSLDKYTEQFHRSFLTLELFQFCCQEKLPKKLSLKLESTNRNIRVASRQTTKTDGVLCAVSVSFSRATEDIDFLTLEFLAIDVIIGLPTVRKMRTHIDLEKDVVRMHIGDKRVTLDMGYDRLEPTEVTDGTDSEELTTDSDDGNTFSSSEEDAFVAVAVQNQE